MDGLESCDVIMLTFAATATNNRLWEVALTPVAGLQYSVFRDDTDLSMRSQGALVMKVDRVPLCVVRYLILC